MKIFLSSLFYLLSIIYAFGQEKADYFIAENPARFDILNLYQQKISEKDKTLLKRFTPWKIIDNDVLMNNQINKAMHVEFNNKSYFFLRDAQGELVQEDHNSYFGLFKNCIVEKDTLIVIKEKGVLFRQIPFFKHDKNYPRNYLKSDDKIIFLFQKKGQHFVQIERDYIFFGWLKILNPRALKAVSASKKISRKNYTYLIDLVISRTDKINNLYKKIFEHLSKKFNKKYQTPYWQINKIAEGIVLNFCIDSPEKFKTSTTHFVSDLESTFFGGPYTISATESEIKIIRRNQ